jgi:two-component system, NarL family, response regulator DevR
LNDNSKPAAKRRLPAAVLFNSYPLMLDVLEPTLRGRTEIVGRATSVADAARLIGRHEPDVLIAGIDASEPEEVFALVRETLDKRPDLKVIAFSSSSDWKLLTEALAAGVDALITQNAALEDIVVAIRQATDPSIHFAPTRLTTSKQEAAASDVAELTGREIETVRLVAKGFSNAEVGRTLRVTEQTVKFHLSNIFRKLKVSNRTQATRRAEQMNLLDENPDVQAQALAR